MHLARYQVEGSEAQVYYFLMFAQIPMTSNIQYRCICCAVYLFHKNYLINIEAGWLAGDGDVAVWGVKCLLGELSFRGTVFWGKCILGELSFGGTVF